MNQHNGLVSVLIDLARAQRRSWRGGGCSGSILYIPTSLELIKVKLRHISRSRQSDGRRGRGFFSVGRVLPQTVLLIRAAYASHEKTHTHAHTPQPQSPAKDVTLLSSAALIWFKIQRIWIVSLKSFQKCNITQPWWTSSLCMSRIRTIWCAEKKPVSDCGG